MLKFYFKLGLNKENKEEFKKPLKIYDEELQKKYKLLYTIRLVCILNILIDHFMFSVAPLWFSLHLSGSSIVGLIISFILYKREKEFMKTYNFSSNIKINVLGYFSYKTKFLLISGVIGFILNILAGINCLSSILLEYDAFKELGMYTGLHKDSPISIWKKKD